MKYIISALFLLLNLNAFSAKVQTPTSLDGATVVTPAEAKKAIDGGATPIDVRKKLEYAEKHIKGAKSLAYKEKSAKKPDYDMGKDKWKFDKIADLKNKPIVIYCNGSTCWKSYKASKMAVKNGFKKVLWLRDGMPAWDKAGLPTE